MRFEGCLKRLQVIVVTICRSLSASSLFCVLMTNKAKNCSSETTPSEDLQRKCIVKSRETSQKTTQEASNRAYSTGRVARRSEKGGHSESGVEASSGNKTDGGMNSELFSTSSQFSSFDLNKVQLIVIVLALLD